MIKKRDWIVMTVIAVIAVGLILLLPALRPSDEKGEAYYVHITVKDADWGVIALVQDAAHIEIKQDTGERNVLAVTLDSVVMQESTCRNQLCVHQGKVTADNRNERPLQNMIICLPNRVTVELLTKSEAERYPLFSGKAVGNE